MTWLESFLTLKTTKLGRLRDQQLGAYDAIMVLYDAKMVEHDAKMALYDGQITVYNNHLLTYNTRFAEHNTLKNQYLAAVTQHEETQKTYAANIAIEAAAYIGASGDAANHQGAMRCYSWWWPYRGSSSNSYPATIGYLNTTSSAREVMAFWWWCQRTARTTGWTSTSYTVQSTWLSAATAAGVSLGMQIAMNTMSFVFFSVPASTYLPLPQATKDLLTQSTAKLTLAQTALNSAKSANNSAQTYKDQALAILVQAEAIEATTDPVLAKITEYNAMISSLSAYSGFSPIVASTPHGKTEAMARVQEALNEKKDVHVSGGW